MQRLGYAARVLGRTDFMVITTGDDNPDIDCRHSGFELRVTVTTVEG